MFWEWNRFDFFTEMAYFTANIELRPFPFVFRLSEGRCLFLGTSMPPARSGGSFIPFAEAALSDSEKADVP